MTPATPAGNAPGAGAPKRWRLRPWLRVGIVAVWLAMAGWLVVREAYPHLFSGSVRGYRALLGDVVVRDDWMRIEVFGHPAGYGHTSIESGGNNPGAFTTIRSEMRLVLNLLGRQQDIVTDLVAELDPWQQLSGFSFRLDAGGTSLTVRGRRDLGTRFNVHVRSAAVSQNLQVDIPDDAILNAAAEELAVRGLRPGQSARLKTFDPATLSVVPVTVKALRDETLRIRGTNVVTTVLASSVAGLQTLAWVDRDGRTLRADTGIGWVLEACTPGEAYAALRTGEEKSQDDLLRRLAVVCQPPVNLSSPRRLKLKLTGVSLSARELTSNRQQAAPAADGAMRLDVVGAAPPTTNGPPPGARFLAATRTLQSDHPDIVSTAAQIVRGHASAFAKARAIHDWVHANLRQEITVSLPSALDVLRTRRGDCNEHATLAVALARAAGIPAVVKVGLVWHRDAFYYHAWPAFFVGDWVETDPTLDQPLVDASHLAFAEGELADQMAILKLMGRLRIELLEAE